MIKRNRADTDGSAITSNNELIKLDNVSFKANNPNDRCDDVPVKYTKIRF